MENSELEYRLEQFKVLKGQGYKYIAGAEHGGLRAYRQIPIRQINSLSFKPLNILSQSFKAPKKEERARRLK